MPQVLKLTQFAQDNGVPEVKIGIFPSLGLVPRLERIVGLGAAKQMVMTAEAVDAAFAERIALADCLL